ncbi:hypothetical protein BDV93DRAFT_559088 [Ceratobasidium sp. AG-I]|nr:hypothetical protein BDV93DRAFT_559088 [Ceratobasidium sp. AG-I]
MSSPQDPGSPLGHLFGLSPENQGDPHDPHDDSDDDEADNAAYNALINDALDSDNPIYEEDEDLGDTMEQPGIKPKHKTIRALKLLSEAGVTLHQQKPHRGFAPYLSNKRVSGCNLPYLGHISSQPANGLR